MSCCFSFSPHSRMLPNRRSTEGAVGQAIFSHCILSVIMSLILRERDPPGCSPHPAWFTKDTVHMYFSLETTHTWSIAALYLYSPLLWDFIEPVIGFKWACCESIVAHQPRCVVNPLSLVINVILKRIYHLFNLCAYCTMLFNAHFTVEPSVNCPAYSISV